MAKGVPDQWTRLIMASLQSRSTKYTFVRVITLLVQVVYIYTLPNYLTGVDFGRFTSYVSIVTIFSVVFNFGFTLIANRYTAETIARTGSRTTLVLALARKYLLLVPAIGGCFFFYSAVLSHGWEEFLCLLIAGMASLFYNLFFDYFYSQSRLMLFGIKDIFLFCMRLGLLLIFYGMFRAASLLSVVLLTEASMFLVCLAIFVALANARDATGAHARVIKGLPSREMYKFGFFSYVTNLLSNIIWIFPFSLLLILRVDLATIGFFNFTVQLFLITLPQVLVSFFVAVLPELYATFERDATAFKSVLKKFMTIPLVFTIPFAGCLYTNARLVIGLAWPAFAPYTRTFFHFSLLSILGVLSQCYVLYFQVIKKTQYSMLIFACQLGLMLTVFPIFLGNSATLDALLVGMLFVAIVADGLLLVLVVVKKGYFSARRILVPLILGFSPFVVIDLVVSDSMLRLIFSLAFVGVYFFTMRALSIFDVFSFLPFFRALRARANATNPLATRPGACRLLMVTEHFFPDIGGVENHVLGLYQALKKKQAKVTIVTASPARYEIPDQAIDERDIIRIPQGGGFVKKWLWFTTHTGLFVTHSGIIFHDFTSLLWALPLVPLLLFKRRLIVFHGFESYPVKLRFIIIRLFASLISPKNICVGDFIHNYYHTRPCAVIYGAVDRVAVPRDPLYDSSGRPRVVRFCFAGRIAADTAILEYSKCVVDFRTKTGADTFFEIFGDGPFKAQVHEILAKGGVPHHFAGWVSNKDRILAEMRQSTFVLAASYLTILDAFSQGCPVISYYQNGLKANYLLGLRKRVHDAPVLCNSPASFTRKVIKLLNDDELREKIVRAAHSYVQNCTWFHIARLYVHILAKGLINKS